MTLNFSVRFWQKTSSQTKRSVQCFFATSSSNCRLSNFLSQIDLREMTLLGYTKTARYKWIWPTGWIGKIRKSRKKSARSFDNPPSTGLVQTLAFRLQKVVESEDGSVFLRQQQKVDNTHFVKWCRKLKNQKNSIRELLQSISSKCVLNEL